MNSKKHIPPTNLSKKLKVTNTQSKGYFKKVNGPRPPAKPQFRKPKPDEVEVHQNNLNRSKELSLRKVAIQSDKLEEIDLEQAFKAFGTVESVFKLKDFKTKKSLNKGYVIFNDKMSALNAIYVGMIYVGQAEVKIFSAVNRAIQHKNSLSELKSDPKVTDSSQTSFLLNEDNSELEVYDFDKINLDSQHAQEGEFERIEEDLENKIIPKEWFQKPSRNSYYYLDRITRLIDSNLLHNIRINKRRFLGLD